KQGDNGSRELIEPILTESEEHVDWLETQLHLVGAVGIQNYLTEQMGEAEEEERDNSSTPETRSTRLQACCCPRSAEAGHVRSTCALRTTAPCRSHHAQPGGQA